MPRKKKRKSKVPRLTILDKGIYFLLIVFFFAAAAFSAPLIYANFRNRLFLDPHLLAQVHSGFIVMFAYFIVLNCLLGAFSISLLRRKQPIFGSSDIEYGPPLWKATYPFFSKRFWLEAYANKRRFFVAATAFILLIVISTCVVLFSLPLRTCIYDDACIKKYNQLDEVTASYTETDIHELEISADSFLQHRRRWRRYEYGIQLKVTMQDGETFFFDYQDFYSGNSELNRAVSGALQIKESLDPRQITVNGTENLPRVIDDMNLNQEEIQLLYQLFDVN